jgi:hypothetical protein
MFYFNPHCHIMFYFNPSAFLRFCVFNPPSLYVTPLKNPHYRFVLDYKIRELKQQIEPRQMEILAMREKIKDMDNELDR